jgi:galactokinase
MLAERVAQRFRQQFQQEPILVRAPGRINLIGEHTDYNEGWVMPAAIDKEFVFALGVNQTGKTHAIAIDKNESGTFGLDNLIPGHGWLHYLMGVQHGLHQIGIPFQGMNVVFGSTIPDGAGLSSSAALCCGYGFAISEAQNLYLARLGIAKIAQYAEHAFAGVKCGLMDQYASLHGKADHALRLDCRTLTHTYVPWHAPELQLVLADTKVKHALAATAYNHRRASCEQAVELLRTIHPHVQSLRDVTEVMLLEQQDALGEDVFVKARFVVQENARLQLAAGLLQQGDFTGFGKILNQTHRALSKEYEASCAESDFLVALGEEEPAVLGARMMGGGFGGCTLNLVRKDRVDYFRGWVFEKYLAQFEKEPDFYLVNLTDGVSRLPTTQT